MGSTLNNEDMSCYMKVVIPYEKHSHPAVNCSEHIDKPNFIHFCYFIPTKRNVDLQIKTNLPYI